MLAKISLRSHNFTLHAWDYQCNLNRGARTGAQLMRIWYKLVVAFAWQQQSCHDDADSIKRHNSPTDGAKNPRLVELPTYKEAVVVVVKESLQIEQSAHAMMSCCRSLHIPQEP